MFNVIHLIGSNLVGGPEKQILNHAVDMQGSEYSVEIGSFHDLKERPEVLVAAEQRKIATFCLQGGLRLGLIRELSQRLKERPGHLLCTHGFKANVVGYLASRRTRTRHVAFLRGWTAENLRVALYEVLERQALKRAQWVVCVSQSQAEQVARLRKHRSPPIVVTNAMLPPYSREDGHPGPTRQQLGIPSEAFVFGSVGRLSIEKGHRFLIAAFHQLSQRLGATVPLFLIVVGDGREQSTLEKQAAELGIKERVFFAGFQGNCTHWMKLFDCLVQPSLTEGTPNSILEAMCLEVPVVATAVGGVPDLITDGHNGLLAPSENSEALAASMKKMLDSPELRRHLIDGSETTRTLYSSAGQRRKLIAVYQQAFAEPFATTSRAI